MINGNDASDVKVVQTNEGAKDGQNKCPKCGSTDISLNVNTSMLRCNFCRFEFEPERAVGLDTDLSQLQGKVVGSGAMNIQADVSDVITLKCTSCGAEVVIDTNESMGARCHWCRNTLSIAEQVPNGSVPDMVLPFSVKKDNARTEIDKFVKKRQFFALPQFKEEFCTENIMGVYLPYMVVGINSQARFAGQGERLVRRYTVGSGRNQRTVYDADLFNVERQFDLVIDGLTITSSSDRMDNSDGRTNNIINAIKPFDTENCVKWDANYLRGMASEKRDTNVDDLVSSVEVKAKDIARHTANSTLKEYDRGVRWRREDLSIKGQQWKASYLPIWLYSYQQKKNNGQNLLHYVAVNARNSKTMGSVPVNKPKLFLFSLIVQIIGTILGFLMAFNIFAGHDEGLIALALLLSGFLYYAYYYNKYRNKKARFKHETDSNATMNNVVRTDNFVKRLTRLRNAKMQGANNTSVGFSSGGGTDLSDIAGQMKDMFK
ncbi:MAG: TFIIB-type zinc ribbon-containing protein [Oscillospiraceae bacterium]|nr:TFIIB-type zinc ribbon-containing protein [Oscillospiraceae bacterium]